ncbi:MAG: hypothetical protein KIS96_06620 [Bauldia sp.]|nr:hypothetical protein [Bauldia sp.]
MDPQTVYLDAAEWKEVREFRVALLRAVGGRAEVWGNHDGLLEEINLRGDENPISAPLRIVIVNAYRVPGHVRDDILSIQEDLPLSTAEHDVYRGRRLDIRIELLSSA